MSKAPSSSILMRMFREQTNHPSTYFSCGLIDDDPYRWRCTIIGSEGTLYSGGMFPSELVFPIDFPNHPPKMQFKCPMWHPNIGKDGVVCISILHEPGDDPNQYDHRSERWLPVHTVESIIVSVISMLNDPNPESPLNVEANRDFLFKNDEYKRKVRQCTSRSIEYC